MKTTLRYLLPAAIVFGLAVAQCGGNDASTTVGTGGSAGFVVSAGGSAGSSGGGVMGGSSGTAGSGVAGGSGSTGAAGFSGPPGGDGGAACPATVPNDGDQCTRRGTVCTFSNELCTCRTGTQTWRCIPLATDGGVPTYDSGRPRPEGGIPGFDGGFTIDDGGISFGDGGNPAACPAAEPQGGETCNATGGSVLVCDYSGTACVCYRVGGRSSWVCY
jgi:hypothetical protein